MPPSQPAEPSIVFEDKHILVVGKPAGLLSQADSSGVPCLVDWARRYVGRHYVGLIHRLDRNTSGIMVLAKRSKAAARLTDALQKGKIERNYLVWFVGAIGQQASWHNWIAKDEKENKVFESSPEDIYAREACLSVTPVKAGNWHGNKVTLCRVELETGRSHQIRIQGALNGHPVLGDTKYGAFIQKPWTRAFGRPAIHSSEISFPHPMTEEMLHFATDLPRDMMIARKSSSLGT